MRQLLEAPSLGPVSHHAENGVDPALAKLAHDREDRARVLHGRHAPDPADDEGPSSDSVRAPVVDVGSRIFQPLLKRNAEAHDRELLP